MQKKANNKLSTHRIEQILLDGQVVNREWLRSKGYGRTAIDYFLRSGKLESLTRGIYRRPGPPLKWQHIYYSLQQMGMAIHVGGQSALELQGFTHYLPLGDKTTVIELYGHDKLPKWVEEWEGNARFIKKPMKCFKSTPKEALTEILFGHWDWKLKISTVELALLELLAGVHNENDFSKADKYFESATTLRPALLNSLLQACTHVHTKRLFLWFAHRHDHAWVKRIDETQIGLGSGKRVIAKGGVLDKTYKITVPKELASDVSDFF